MGVNRHIDFCNESNRIAFIKNFDSIEMVPVPHRNTINFLGMKPKNSYLIWREVNGVFSALNKTGVIDAWVIATGKLTKTKCKKEPMAIAGYQLYPGDGEASGKSKSYHRNWHQHPDYTISLLRSETDREHYKKEMNSLCNEG